MGKLVEMGEFGFIRALASEIACDDPDVLLGIGDDCALVRLGGALWAVTTDAMLEGRHFRRDWLTPQQIGARAMTAGLSDVAAMGARPRFAFTSLALPPQWEAEDALQLARGLAEQARRYGVCLLGGDTVAAHEHALVDVVVLGECAARVWRRDTARVGDVLCVTGTLGDCAAALAARTAGVAAPLTWEAYASPQPRVPETAAWQRLEAITAALDVSDGLVQDAGHLCERSSVGIRIEAARVPTSDGARRTAEALGTNPLPWALGGGEDFELLFTAAAGQVAALQGSVETPVTVIGEVVPGDAVEVLDEDGRVVPVLSRGWDHFSSAAGA